MTACGCPCDACTEYCEQLEYPCAHNTVPVRVWFRFRWLCVRCGETFRRNPCE